jgi:mono/diheme cytochrome c family protein
LTRRALVSAACLLGLALAGCRQDMHDQPRYKPYRESDFFGDRRSARPPVEGTVARGMLREDTHLYAGKVDGALAETFPFPVTGALLQRGRERYGIYCTPCHGLAGNGDGMIVTRGYRKPSSFHVDRLRAERPGYFYDVITNGFGAMPDYAAQIPVEDRWAIVGYVRALQLSQNATVADVPSAQRGALGAPPSAAPSPEGHH